MNIAPTPEFQRAFKRVTGLECSPQNLVNTIQENPDLFLQVREIHADIVMLARQRRLVNELKQRLEKHKPTSGKRRQGNERDSEARTDNSQRRRLE